MKVALTPEYLAFVRQLRREQTDAEKLLWYCLRGRQLCGLKFRRQYPIRSLCPRLLLPRVQTLHRVGRRAAL